MTAGRRDQLVTLQSYTATQDDHGEETQVWSDIGTEWAAVLYGRGDERRQAAMEQAAQPATFQMLANETTRALKISDRIVHDRYYWDIVGIAPMNRTEIEVTANRAGEAEAES